LRVAIPITPKTRLADYRDALVGVGCQQCFHEREMTAEALAQIIGWQSRVISAIPRMRCSACGAHKAHVFLFYPRRPRGWSKNAS
jgi:hypothetical protein